MPLGDCLFEEPDPGAKWQNLCNGCDFTPDEIRDAKLAKDRAEWREKFPNRTYILVGYGYPDSLKRYETTLWFCKDCAREVLFYGQYNQLRTKLIADRIK